MTEYIKREAAIRVACIGCCEEGNCNERCVDIARLIEIPAADVVEVVRCKDCRFCMAFKGKSDGFYGFYGHCRIWITRTISDYAALVDADGYCSYGERKEG